MAKDSTKRKYDSPNFTNGKTQNKRAKISENQQDTLTENDESELVSSSKNKLNVFNYNSDQLFELFIFHGISPQICDMFQEMKLDGQSFKKWPHDDIAKFTSYLKKLIQSYPKDKQSKNLTQNDFRHLHALSVRYSLDPIWVKCKIFCDSVHGQINVHPLLVRIIDTPQFQRLRGIKQLGILNYVYPSANHTRFEHCIGTSHLAGLLVKSLKDRQPSLRITNSDELCVSIAGLCHDLGHGPFSHMFEEVIEKIVGKSSWKHEITTIKLFDRMFEKKSLKFETTLKQEFESYGLFENDLQFIKDLIYCQTLKDISKGSTYDEKLAKVDSLNKRGLEKSFLFEIVSNCRNNIDVDKFDYFERDCKNLGFTNNFNYQRYIATIRVIKAPGGLNQICAKDKDIFNLYEMFHVREYLTRRAYKHETGMAINVMVVDALAKADTHFKFSEIVNENKLDEFEKLDDTIFSKILNSKEKDLEASREILQRVSDRRLYKFVGSCVLPENSKLNKKQLESDFKSFLSKKFSNFWETNKEKISNTFIEKVNFNYGSKNKNPLDNVSLWNKIKRDEMKSIKREQISRMLLNVFEDSVVRIFCKDDDSVFHSDLYLRFCDWAKEIGSSDPIYGALP